MSARHVRIDDYHRSTKNIVGKVKKEGKKAEEEKKKTKETKATPPPPQAQPAQTTSASEAVPSQAKTPQKTAAPEAKGKQQAAKADEEAAQAQVASAAASGVTSVTKAEQPKAAKGKSGRGAAAAAVKKQTKKKTKEKEARGQTDIRDHFPIRRSARHAQGSRAPADMIKREDDSADRLESRNVPGKGKGIFAKAPFGIGEYVCEYAGDLLQRDEAKARERAYDEEAREAGRTEVMCYMYFFKYNNAEWCVDATKSSRVGRLINHSRTNYNLRTKLFVVDGVPHLGLVACKAIAVDEELCYDYGERDPETLQALPWLKE